MIDNELVSMAIKLQAERYHLKAIEELLRSRNCSRFVIDVLRGESRRRAEKIVSIIEIAVERSTGGDK